MKNIDSIYDIYIKYDFSGKFYYIEEQQQYRQKKVKSYNDEASVEVRSY